MQEGAKFAAEHDALFFETSAKTGKNIQNLLEEIGACKGSANLWS